MKVHKPKILNLPKKLLLSIGITKKPSPKYSKLIVKTSLQNKELFYG